MSVVGDKRTGGFNENPIKKRRQFVIPKSSNIVNSQGLSECFQKLTTSLYVSLAPCHNSNPINGIKEQHLDPLIMTYFSKAKGVVLAYSNIRLNDDNKSEDTSGNAITIAKVEGSSPFTFFWITVDLLIWRPQLGDILEGHIYMQTPSHIGILVHDTFNASIKKMNIPNDWSFIPSQKDEYSEENSNNFKSFGYWVDENEMKIEGKLKFTIKAIHTAGKVVSVEGTLIEPGSEKESQPILRDRRSSASSNINKHKKFDDDIPTVTEIPEPTESEEIPAYQKESGSDEDEAVVNNSDSSDDESD